MRTQGPCTSEDGRRSKRWAYPVASAAPASSDRSSVVETTKQNPSEITADVRIGSLPATVNRPAQDGTVAKVSASVTDEYVSAGGWAWYANYARALSWSIDDVTRDLGSRFYERMEYDAEVASLINGFKASLLEDGLHISSCIDDKDDPDYDDAEELSAWCNAALKELKPGMMSVLWDMCDAILFGNKVAELVWEHRDDKDGELALLPRTIKPKPRESIAFVCDAYLNVLGMLVLLPGMSTTITPDMLIVDLKMVPNFIPREKFMVYTFRMRDSDPRGRSIARPAYNAWNLKMQSWAEYLKFLMQFASPLLIGFPSPDSETQYNDPSGVPLPVPITPETAMVNELVKARNGTALAFAPGSLVQPIEMKGEGAPFREFIDTMDRQMAKGILGQALSTEEGKHQTRAATGSHENIRDSLVRVAKPDLEDAVRNDLLDPMIRYNKPDKLRLMPLVALGRTETRDFHDTASGVAALETAGYLGESQRAGIDSMLGLPARDLDADAAAEAEALPPLLPAPATPPGAPSPAPGKLPVAGQSATKTAAAKTAAATASSSAAKAKGAA